jgi:energy-coupling factor transporter ATP-binding protein EcfA2/energy-coupling factor transporter transmembrane protein EcfT
LHHVVLERWSRGRSALHRCDPRVKIVLLAVFLIALATLPRISLVSVGALAALIVAAIAAAQLPAGGLLLRAAVVLPFPATVALVSWLAGDPERALALLVKSYISAAAVLVVVATTPMPKLLRGIEALGAPRFLVDVVQFLYRYLFVVSEQAQHMLLAARSRGGTRFGGFAAAAGAVAVLFARSYARADGIHRAMLARSRLDAAAGAEGVGPGVVIAIRGLRYRYQDGTQALDGIDFELLPGETVALLGPNGSGKTTFVHHLNGLLAGEGEVTVCGLRVEKANLPAIRRKVGLVFQDSDEQLFMPTVLEDVSFGPLNLGQAPEQARRAAERALRQVGMEHALDKAPYHLSAGEKRRAALAGVLAMEPEILVLDEPTTFLDPAGQRDLAELLRNLPQAKVIVTHDTAFARLLAHRAVFFDRGRIVADGPIDEVIRQFRWDPHAAWSELEPTA